MSNHSSSQGATPFWLKPKSKRMKTALVLSLIFHTFIGLYIANLIRQNQRANPFEEIVHVEWVPPPPVKLKMRPREIPKEVPKVVQTQSLPRSIGEKAPSALTTKLARRSPQQIAEVIVKGPEIVRESVELNRDAPISQILPIVTTAAKFETKAETRDTIAPPVATFQTIAAPGSGIVTNRVRAAGSGKEQGLSDVNSYGTSLRGGSEEGGLGRSGAGDGLGDDFADVGTTPPKTIQIDQAAKEQARDLFGIGEYVEETRGKESQEVVYVLDVSSSMSGSKLHLAVQALKDALSMLYERDSFNIVTFDSDVRVYSRAMLPVNRDNLAKAYRFLDGIQIRSGTNLWGGLERALALEASTVVLISDGDPSRGITAPNQILALARERNSSHARIMTIALGHGLSDGGVRLLKRLADEHGGQLLLIDLR